MISLRRLLGMADENNKLTKQNQFGKALFDAAFKSYQNEQQEEVVDALRQEFNLRDQTQNTIDEAQFQLAYYNKVLAAIEAGEFTIQQRYNAQGTVILNDRNLKLGHIQRDQLSEEVRAKLEL